MELFLLKLFAFLRPLFLIEIQQKLAGLNPFDIAAIGLLGVLLFAFSARIAMSRQLALSNIDTWMIVYVFWCIAVSLIYPDKTDFRELIKWITPFITYIVGARIIKHREDYPGLIFLMLIGFVIPILASAATIFLNYDFTIKKIVGASQLPAYQGVYGNSGNLGLSMTLFFMLGAIYASVALSHFGETKKLDRVKVIFFALVGLFALYCLIKSQSRTGQLGLLIFLAVYLYQVSKKWLLVAALVVALLVAIMSPLLRLMYIDVIEVQQGERPFEKIASGRPNIWAHNLSEFSKTTIDRHLAGVGIGNRVGMGRFAPNGGESFWSSHNDFLAVLIHTGIIGLVIFLCLQFAILKKILAIEGKEKFVFLALFLAVAAMNFASNSYVSRYGLAQMYYLALTYLALPRTTNARNVPRVPLMQELNNLRRAPLK